MWFRRRVVMALGVFLPDRASQRDLTRTRELVRTRGSVAYTANLDLLLKSA